MLRRTRVTHIAGRLAAVSRVKGLMCLRLLSPFRVSVGGVIDVGVVDRAHMVVHDGPKRRRAAAHMHVVTWLHLRKNLAESRAEASDALIRILEGQVLPHVVVGPLSLEVREILLAAGARRRADVLLAEHGRVIRLRLVAAHEVKQLTDFLAQLGETLVDVLFHGKLAEHLLDHGGDLVQDRVLHLQQLRLVRLSWQDHLDVVELTDGLLAVLLKLLAELLQRRLEAIDFLRGLGTAADFDWSTLHALHRLTESLDQFLILFASNHDLLELIPARRVEVSDLLPERLQLLAKLVELVVGVL